MLYFWHQKMQGGDMKKMILAWILLAWSIWAYADESDWVYVGGSRSDNSFYVTMHKTSISRAYNNIINVWFQNTYAKPQKAAGQNKNYYISTKHRDQINCATSQMGTVSGTSYNYRGVVVDSFTSSYVTLNDVVPDTIGEAMFKTACQQAGLVP
jgi:hypothetical protein